MVSATEWIAVSSTDTPIMADSSIPDASGVGTATPLIQQVRDPLAHRRLGDLQRPGDLGVTQPPVHLQHLDDPAIKIIHPAAPPAGDPGDGFLPLQAASGDHATPIPTGSADRTSRPAARIPGRGRSPAPQAAPS